MMKNLIAIIILLSHSLLIFGQKQEPLALLETDSTWKKEVFHFPLGFARDIPYEGVEEAVFPVGWGKPDSSTFWSYVFAWNIKRDAVLTEKELEESLQKYFDGLMGKENAVALFLKKEDTKGASRFVGKISTFDNFSTKKPLILQVLVEQYYCEQKKKAIILFRFSPKAFGHAVWKTLNEVKLRADSCDF